MSGDLALLALAATAFVIWFARAYFMPFANCRRCHGTKANAVTRSFGNGKRFGPCGKCKGSGSRQVLGAKQVHQLVRSLRSGNSRKG